MAHRKIRRGLTARIRRIFAAAFGRTPRSQLRSLGGRRIVADGLEHNLWTDFYHNAIAASWPTFFGSLAASFVALNLVFSCVYWLGRDAVANARSDSLVDYFFFSVETISTVGYGDMHPQTLYGHFVATTETFIGLVAVAVMTGLVFARFSRPRARLVFSRHPVIADHDGTPTLIFRLANARNTFISEAAAKLWMLTGAKNREGRRFVGFQQLRLLKSENPVLALSWTLFHPIDADSPLHGMSESDLIASETNFVVSIRGHDETSAQTVHARYTFTAQDVRPGHEFVDIHSLDERGMRHIDYSKIHDTRPIPPRLADPSREERGEPLSPPGAPD